MHAEVDESEVIEIAPKPAIEPEEVVEILEPALETVEEPQQAALVEEVTNEQIATPEVDKALALVPLVSVFNKFFRASKNTGNHFCARQKSILYLNFGGLQATHPTRL